MTTALLALALLIPPTFGLVGILTLNPKGQFR